jgi:hypothetical protein
MTSRRPTKYQILLLALHPEQVTWTNNLPPKDKALAELREATGQDFGDDAEKWKAWFKKHPKGRAPVSPSDRNSHSK